MPPTVQYWWVAGSGAKVMVVALRGAVQIVADDARLQPRSFGFRIEGNEPVEVFREIDHHRDIAGLAGQTGAAATAENGNVAIPALLNRDDHVLDGSGDYYANRRLPVHGQVRRIKRARSGVEPDFALYAFPQRRRKVGR